MYEARKARQFASHIGEGDVVLDIGAHVGYYTLLAARRVGSTGAVHAFEPHPTNIDFLQKHVALNNLSGIVVWPYAVSDRSRPAHFATHGHRAMSHLSEQGDLAIACVSIDTLYSDVAIPCPSIIKIDVEGAEEDVLKGAATVLSTCKPLIFLATHGDIPRNRCISLLVSLGYEVRSLDGKAVEAADEFIAYHPPMSRTRK